MRFRYPYRTEQHENSIVVEFPDVPGALTEVRDEETAAEIIEDCLMAALGGYIKSKKIPPSPSDLQGRPCVTLDLVTSAKLTLAVTMSERRVSNVELARKLGVTEKVVRRLLDPDHRCRIDRLEDALNHLGLCLELKVRRDHRTDRKEHQGALSPDVDQRRSGVDSPAIPGTSPGG